MNFTCKNLRRMIREYVQFCLACQKMSQIKNPIHAHPFTTSRYYPMECLNMDYVGPYLDGGYILVIVDTFTRWVELYHSPDATAQSAASSLLQHFGRYGATIHIQSDRGPQFVAILLKEFFKLIGTEHCLTMAYSKDENSIVERANKEVNRYIRAHTFMSLHVHTVTYVVQPQPQYLSSTFRIFAHFRLDRLDR
jgi:transposase InsO family protein